MYLNAFPDSALAVNLKACNTFRMYNGKAAENELRNLAELSGGTHLENDLIRHNLVVFRGGENALQVAAPAILALPTLMKRSVIFKLCLLQLQSLVVIS